MLDMLEVLLKHITWTRTTFLWVFRDGWSVIMVVIDQAQAKSSNPSQAQSPSYLGTAGMILEAGAGPAARDVNWFAGAATGTGVAGTILEAGAGPAARDWFAEAATGLAGPGAAGPFGAAAAATGGTCPATSSSARKDKARLTRNARRTLHSRGVHLLPCPIETRYKTEAVSYI